jgi:hypothetical protein
MLLFPVLLMLWLAGWVLAFEKTETPRTVHVVECDVVEEVDQ